MSEPRYRIGINKEQVFDWHGWYSDYETETQAIHELRNAVERDLKKFRLYEVKPNKELTEEKRRQIFFCALADIAKTYGPIP